MAMQNVLDMRLAHAVVSRAHPASKDLPSVRHVLLAAIILVIVALALALVLAAT